MLTDSRNLFHDLPRDSTAEVITQLLATTNLRIDRIISTGQASPEGFWYDQDWSEWVLLLAGEAKLRLDGEAEPVRLVAGSWVHLPAHQRHRVEWTSTDPPAVWLAVHYR
jgi:cupin 2 domain-containing protein